MPRAKETDKSSRTESAPYPPSALRTSGYALRGVRYEYSHTKAPTLASPPRDTARPVIPASAAQKRKGKIHLYFKQPVSKTSRNKTSEPVTTQEDCSRRGVPREQLGPGDELDGEGEQTTPSASNETGIPMEHDRFNQQVHIPEPANRCAQTFTQEVVFTQATPARQSSGQIAQPTPTRMGVSTLSTWDFATPTSQGPAISILSASPLTFRFRPPSEWPSNFNNNAFGSLAAPSTTRLPSAFSPDTQRVEPSDEDILPDLFVPNITTQFNFPSSTMDFDFNYRANAGPSFSSDLSLGQSALTTAQAANLGQFPDASTSTQHFESLDSVYLRPDAETNNLTLNEPLHRLATPQLHTTDLATLHASILRSLPQAPNPSPNLLTVRGHTLPLPSLNALGSRNPSPAPVNSRGRSPTPSLRAPTPYSTSRASSPAASSIQAGRTALSRSATPVAGDTNVPAPPVAPKDLRRSNFSYSQLQFTHAMKFRWRWSLLAEDAFPIDTTDAMEACISYGEVTTGVTRIMEGIGMPAWDYVRIKDSGIRNDAKSGVLAKVEELYGVNGTSKAKVKELLKYNNFLFVGYDPLNLSKVSGRFKHPCIVEVVRSVLFFKKTRGKPIGARFVRELISISSQESLRDYKDKTANYGAPVPAIAFACTLILHSLHQLERGRDSRNRLATKMPNFDDATYAAHYRGFLKQLREYARLAELRRFYMAPLLEDYKKLYPDGIVAEDEEEDAERYSDGE